ncbi:hypothetical protein ZOSMA_58G00440 [Zostera marina]|uniref:Myb-like domain-containing protein n=1 Tax=Zostera marina TaxID=29655 RepID=A0A0K9NVC9_ZOSMR|nr:hypothetical protein ZOSMA_58G00440 [Zostera marina]
MSRFTCFRIIPDWSLHEMLTLVLEIDAVDDEHGSTISSHQKWNIIADHLIALNIYRNSSQCHGKWDSLLYEHCVIKDWESRSRYQTASTSRSNGSNSYWCLELDKRKDLKLPMEFDRELFRLIEGFIDKEVIKTKDHMMVVPEIDSPSSPPSSSSLSEGNRGKKRTRKDEIIELFRENCGKLQVDVERIEIILKKKPNAANTEEFTRQQVDQLITLFGEVTSTFDRLNI